MTATSIGGGPSPRNSALIRSAVRRHSWVYLRYSGMSIRDGLSRARNRTRPSHDGCSRRNDSKARNPRRMFLVGSARSTRSTSFASPRHRSRSRRAARTSGVAAAARIDAVSMAMGCTRTSVRRPSRSTRRRRRSTDAPGRSRQASRKFSAHVSAWKPMTSAASIPRRMASAMTRGRIQKYRGLAKGVWEKWEMSPSGRRSRSIPGTRLRW